MKISFLKQEKISPSVCNCLKVLGCRFSISASSLGIAAFIFAHLTPRNIFISPHHHRQVISFQIVFNENPSYTNC